MSTQMSRFAMVGTALESAFARPTNLALRDSVWTAPADPVG
jgi:hypothetical protein